LILNINPFTLKNIRHITTDIKNIYYIHWIQSHDDREVTIRANWSIRNKGYGCLAPLSTVIVISQSSGLLVKEYSQKPIDLHQDTVKLYHIKLYRLHPRT